VCGCSGFSGGSVTGAFVVVGGGVGVLNRVQIGDAAKVGAFCLVSKDVASGEVVSGYPQRPHKEFLKANAVLTKFLKEKQK
jgi:UDP-3-O-[3-hydroxymyristoyl] glucosamine N-acyltransferase